MGIGVGWWIGIQTWKQQGQKKSFSVHVRDGKKELVTIDLTAVYLENKSYVQAETWE